VNQTHDYRVTVEDFPGFPTPNLATIYPKKPDLPAIARGDVDCENCTDLQIPAETFLEDPACFAEFEGILRLEAPDPSPALLLRVHAAGRRDKTEICIDPRNVGDGTPVLVALSLDLPVSLAPENVWPSGVVEQLAEYFLYSPTLRVPIRPLAAVSVSLGDPRGPDLWRVYGETLGGDFHVDAENRVSLSPRWARAGRYFGRVGDGPETYRASELWRHVAGHEDRCFTDLTPCATCPHFRYCRGFFRAGVEDEEDCAPWRNAMDQIVEAWHANQEAERV
jgi:hypothetical protein